MHHSKLEKVLYTLLSFAVTQLLKFIRAWENAGKYSSDIFQRNCGKRKKLSTFGVFVHKLGHSDSWKP